MTAALERQVLAQVLMTYCNEQNPPIAVDVPNRKFDKPDMSSGQPWIRLTIIDSDAKTIELGATPHNTRRVIGVLILQIFIPSDQGDLPALQLADAIGLLYRQKILNFPDSPSSGSVRLRDPNTRVIGRNPDGWYQVNLTIPFHRDDLLLVP